MYRNYCALCKHEISFLIFI